MMSHGTGLRFHARQLKATPAAAHAQHSWSDCACARPGLVERVVETPSEDEIKPIDWLVPVS